MMQPNDSQAEAPIQSRAQAYRMLTEVANYLMETEPHSPTPYLVRRAISWGNMSLSELLREIVYDENDIRLIYQLLGMSSEQQSTNEGQEY